MSIVASPAVSRHEGTLFTLRLGEFRASLLPYSPVCAERLYEKSSNPDEPPPREANHGSVHHRLAARTRLLIVHRLIRLFCSIHDDVRSSTHLRGSTPKPLGGNSLCRSTATCSLVYFPAHLASAPLRGLLRALEERQRPIVYAPLHGEQEILGGPLGCRTVFAEAASSGSKAARRYRGFAVGEVHGRKMDLKKLPERRLGRKRPTWVC